MWKEEAFKVWRFHGPDGFDFQEKRKNMKNVNEYRNVGLWIDSLAVSMRTEFDRCHRALGKMTAAVN